MIRLFARIYTETNYQSSYGRLAQLICNFVQDGWSISSTNRAIRQQMTRVLGFGALEMNILNSKSFFSVPYWPLTLHNWVGF